MSMSRYTMCRKNNDRDRYADKTALAVGVPDSLMNDQLIIVHIHEAQPFVALRIEV